MAMDSNQRALINELRSRLGDRLDKSYDDPTGFNLLRWLYHFDNDLDRIEPLLLETLEFRKSLKLDQWDELFSNGEFRRQFHPIMLNYFPGGQSGIDKHGNPILIIPMGLIKSRTSFSLVRNSEFILWRVFETEHLLKQCMEQEQIRNKKCGLILIVDLHGLSLDDFYLPALDVFSAKISIIQAHYPDIATTMYVVNAPTIVSIGVRLLSPFIAKRNMSKIEFLPRDEKQWKTMLAEQLGAENLPVHWGGNRTGKFGAYGDVIQGGQLPPHVKPSHPKMDASLLTEIHIRRNGVHTIPFSVNQSEKTQLIKWYFTCSSGGIEFGIRKTDPKATWRWVTPKLSLHAEYVPEYGEQQILEPGQYELLFDNSKGRFRSKKVSYSFSIESVQ